MGNVLNEYADLMKGILEGAASEEDEAIADKMTAAADEMAQAGKSMKIPAMNYD